VEAKQPAIPKERYVSRRSVSELMIMRGAPPSGQGRIVVFVAAAMILFPPASFPALAFNFFATHEVTVQFATRDGKPLADAEVRVFAPEDPKNPVTTGRTDAAGKFIFEAGRDGFWSAEAHSADQVARVVIRVGDESRPQPVFSPFLVIGILAVLAGIVIWYRVLRLRTRRPRS
jgi:hypothetical protein